ncbi:MAG: pyridoxal phosphate-dependent aminotransferase [Erysipelotrichaceae bacterium]|nr:pyridoxal phosphate-dependent aminotransferase [Erysipelotrichaceae bacterium]
MKYDFTTVANRRNIGAGKWELMLEKNPNVAEGVIPYSVADMEFYNAPELMKGLAEYAMKPIYGYTSPMDTYYNAVIDYMNKYHNWEIQKEWICPTSGVVGALNDLVRTLTEPGDGVVIMRPVYYPFSSAITRNNRNLVNVPLINNNGRYEIDFEAFDQATKPEEVKMFILCSPHNPIGRVWTKDELRKMGDICVKNNIIIISDEIHFDFIMDKHEHTVISTLSEEIAKRTVVCTAPSKTFNLGGVKVSNIIIQNPEYREKYVSVTHSLNTFAYKTCEIVYTECRDWFEELMEVLHENKKLVEDFIAEHLPMIKVYPLEGTYLMWLDCRALGLSNEELENLMLKNDLYLDEGYLFGEEGSGFERWNIACPKQELLSGLERFKAAIETL